MNLNVTQDNLYLFLPSKISWIADMLVTNKNMSVVDAIKKIYSSHLGPVALYHDLLQEDIP